MELVNYLIAIGAGGAALYLWGVICWMGLPHHLGDTEPLGDAEEDVSEALRKANLKPFWYMLPHFRAYEGGLGSKEFASRYEKGPNAAIIIMPPGPCMEPKAFLVGFLLNLMTAAGFALLYWLGAAHMPGLLDKVLVFVSAAFLFGAVPPLMQSNWWRFPWRPAFTLIFDLLVGAALVAALFHVLLG